MSCGDRDNGGDTFGHPNLSGEKPGVVAVSSCLRGGINQVFYVLAGLNRDPASGTRRFTGAPVGTT